jgi:hypothetical protein
MKHTKATKKKLTLMKETVTALTESDLVGVAAGIPPSHSYLCMCPN